MDNPQPSKKPKPNPKQQSIFGYLAQPDTSDAQDGPSHSGATSSDNDVETSDVESDTSEGLVDEMEEGNRGGAVNDIGSVFTDGIRDFTLLRNLDDVTLQGVLCVACVLFAPDTVDNERGKPNKLGQLVNKPLVKYAHLTAVDGKLTDHLSRYYHTNAQGTADDLLKSLASGTDIRQTLDTDRRKHVVEQRERLTPIVKTTIICGRIGISYRGRRDDGALDPDAPIAKGDGNFKALLDFRIDSGDTKLEQHLQTAGRNATYISKTTQNELIEICGDCVAEELVSEVHTAQYFSVIADETTDSAHNEQLCVCIRFVSKQNDTHIVKEEFVSFGKADDLTGGGLANQILGRLRSLELDITNLVGQGYDGAAAMSGCANGVQQHIRQEAPSALYVHCGSHVLNLVLNAASSVPEIRNMFGVVREVTEFINSSPKRWDVLKGFMGESSVALKTLCETRFAERHDALLIFCENLVAIYDCMDQLTLSKDTKTSDKARSLAKSVSDSGFIVSLCCANKVMALTVILSRSLQTVNSDLVQAITSVNHILGSLDTWRDRDEAHWTHHTDGAYSHAIGKAELMDTEIVIPRLAARQNKRNNVPATTTEEYYKRAIWYPYLATITQSIKARFSNHQLLMLKMAAFVPSVIASHKWADVVDTVKLYQSHLGGTTLAEVEQEYLQWKAFCLGLSIEDRPDPLLESLDIIPERFPNVKTLLWIFATVPVTTCTAERAFSAMKILKDYLRNRMNDERLNELALMYIHQDISISIDRVIDEFAARKNRKLDFVL